MISATEQRERTKLPELDLRALIIKTLDEAKPGQKFAHVAGFLGHSKAQALVAELQELGYTVEFKLRDGGDTATISW